MSYDKARQLMYRQDLVQRRTHELEDLLRKLKNEISGFAASYYSEYGVDLSAHAAFEMYIKNMYLDEAFKEHLSASDPNYNVFNSVLKFRLE